MKKELLKLIQLQEVDDQLDTLRAKRGDLPDKLTKLKSQIDQLETSISNGNERLEVINKDLSKYSAEIEDSQAKLNRYKDQLYLVTTNKEYDALQQEMDNTREIINSHENVLLELEDEKVNLEESLKRNMISFEELSKTFAKNQIDLDNALAETIDEENRLTPIRDDLAGTIKRSYLFTYNRFRDARGGKGIISVARSACGLCYNHLPPQMIVEIRQNDKFITCPNCGIYLYWEDE